MDEEYGDSIDASTDMDISDVDVSDDIPAEIPEDLPEDDYSGTDIADEVSEDVSEDPVVDDSEYDETDESIEEDCIAPENGELDEAMDEIEEDSLEESEDLAEDYEEQDDITEDTDDFVEVQNSEMDDAEEILEDTDNYEVTDQEETFTENISEDVSDAETVDDTTDAEDTNATEQSEDITNTEETEDVDDTEDVAEQLEDMPDAEATDEKVDAESTDTTEQQENKPDTEVVDAAADVEDIETSEQLDDVSDTETADEVSGVEDNEISEQLDDVPEIETADEVSDVEDTEISERLDDVLDTEAADEASDVEDTEDGEQLKAIDDTESLDDMTDNDAAALTEQDVGESDTETYDYETSPEVKDSVNPEISGELVSAENPYRERWEQFGEEFSDDGEESEGWDSLKEVPFSGDETLDGDIRTNDMEQPDRGSWSSDDSPKVLKRNEYDLLKSGNDAINQRLEVQADDYRDRGMSETEIEDRLAADKWKFQKEFLDDAFPGEDVSPNVFNGFSEHGSKDRIEEMERSELLREIVTKSKDKNADMDSDVMETQDRNHPLSEGVIDEFSTNEAPAVNSEFNAENDVPIIPRPSDLDRRIIDIFPEGRRKAIDEAFADAPQELVETLNDYSDGLKYIKDSGYELNENGQMVKLGCYYEDGSDTITMDEHMTDAEYAEVFPHEFGHYVDCQKGWESTDADFTQAIQEDIGAFDKLTPEGKAHFNDMLDDAFSTGAAYDRSVTDILSAMFGNDSDIIQRFNDENVAYYQHTNDYWSIPGMIQKEIYANNMAIQVSQTRVSKNFIERWFGSTTSCFKEKFGLNN